MVRYLPVIIVILLTIFCVVDVAQSRSDDVRVMPRWLWAVAVIGLPVAGSVCWLLWGRPRSSTPPTRRHIGPDDDPDFLRGLK